MFLIFLSINLNAVDVNNINNKNNHQQKEIHQSITIPNPYKKVNNNKSFNEGKVIKNINSNNKNINDNMNKQYSKTSDNSINNSPIIIYFYLIVFSCFFYKFLLIPVFLIALYMFFFKLEILN
jgi:hypothetical protein